MDIVQPLDGKDMPNTDTTCSEGAHIVKMSKATAELLKQSFVSVKNEKKGSRSGMSMHC